jgi:hypothetical protein
MLDIGNPGGTIVGVAALELDVSEEFHGSECATSCMESRSFLGHFMNLAMGSAATVY